LSRPILASLNSLHSRRLENTSKTNEAAPFFFPSLSNPRNGQFCIPTQYIRCQYPSITTVRHLSFPSSVSGNDIKLVNMANKEEKQGTTFPQLHSSSRPTASSTLSALELGSQPHRSANQSATLGRSATTHRSEASHTLHFHAIFAPLSGEGVLQLFKIFLHMKESSLVESWERHS